MSEDTLEKRTMLNASALQTFRVAQIPYRQYDIGRWPKTDPPPKYNGPTQAKTLSFVDFTTISDNEVTRNKYLVRSHISKRKRNRRSMREEPSNAVSDKQPHAVERGETWVASHEVSVQGANRIHSMALSVSKAPPYFGLIPPKTPMDIKHETVAATAQYSIHLPMPCFQDFC